MSGPKIAWIDEAADIPREAWLVMRAMVVQERLRAPETKITMPGITGPYYAPVGDVRPIGGNYQWTT